jgi:endonuclease/exonuclease/phosphatase family metal-dependent hydrolase
MKKLHIVFINVMLMGLITASSCLPAQDTLKILTYNIQGMKPGTQPGMRLAFIIEKIIELDPDIIGLQEVNEDVSGSGLDNQGMAITKALSDNTGLDYHYYQEFTHKSWDNQFNEYIGIISKYPVEEEGYQQLATGVFPRKAIWNFINTPMGMINFYCTHLSYNSQSVRLQQVEQIDAFIEETNQTYEADANILCGDFNDIPASGPVTYLTNPGPDGYYFDAYRVANPGLPGFTVPSDDPERRIDYIFYTNLSYISVEKAKVVMEGEIFSGQYRSDHLGVLCIIRKNNSAVGEPGSGPSANKLFRLTPVYPNPCQSNTTIEFDLFNEDHVLVCLYDLTGREIRVLKDEVMPAGNHKIKVNTRELNNQVLYYQVQVENIVENGKLVIMH